MISRCTRRSCRSCTRWCATWRAGARTRWTISSATRRRGDGGGPASSTRTTPGRGGGRGPPRAPTGPAGPRPAARLGGGALVAAAVIGVALIGSRWTGGAPIALIVLAAAAAVGAAGAVAWCLAPLRRVPGDRQVARYIEERASSLDDRLVTAVDVAQ